MLEPPSQELVRQLTELQLCRPADLRLARSRVKRLAHDLPAFDSVWIDSLVQLRLLTPYQARLLEEGRSDQLRIGSLVVIDELGHSPRGVTLLARQLNRRDQCVIKRQCVPAERLSGITTRMHQVLDRANGFVHPHLVLPHQLIPSQDNELITVSRLVPGLPLNELLVRRGRFPADIVLEIGRHLLEGLAALHSRSLLHGDVRMSNVRLTESGLAVLVDGGLRPVLHPEITIHDTLSLEAYDGLAPELIGTGAPVSMNSELYALGCLLWQLLAGRPPFITADPLAKLAAHQTQKIADVRTLAPDTPPLLADLIAQMTSPAPQQRPRGFADVLQRWGRGGSFGRSKLRQFRQLFDTAVPHFSHKVVSGGSTYWVWLLAFLVTASGSVALFYDPGLRTELLELPQRLQSLAQQSRNVDPNEADEPSATSGTNRATRGQKNLRPLPNPSADGVVTLTEKGPYAASAITFAGNLTIHGLNGAGSEIVIEDAPLTLTAQTVTLDHVTIRSRKDASVPFLAKIQCQQLNVTNCDLMTNSDDSDGISPEIMGLAWTPFDRDSRFALISVKNSIFRGSGTAIPLAQPPRMVQISNTLKTGRGAFLALGPKSSASDCKVELNKVTLRQSGPLMRMAGACTQKLGIAPVQFEATHCLFNLTEPQAGFLVVDSDRLRPDIHRIAEMKARESFITPGTSLLVAFDVEHHQTREIEVDEQFEGLEVGEVQFSGSRLDRIADARATGLKGPRRAANVELPGIEPRQLGPAAKTTSAQPDSQ